jgi:hypothetical protein
MIEANASNAQAYAVDNNHLSPVSIKISRRGTPKAACALVCVDAIIAPLPEKVSMFFTRDDTHDQSFSMES